MLSGANRILEKGTILITEVSKGNHFLFQITRPISVYLYFINIFLELVTYTESDHDNCLGGGICCLCFVTFNFEGVLLLICNAFTPTTVDAK